MEPIIPTALSFSNLCPTPYQDDGTLPFISRMLLEEDDAVDEFLCQQYPDLNPALLQTQQLFAQVLSDDASSSSALAAVHAGGAQGNGLQDDPPSLNSTAAVEPANTLSPCKDAVSMAFFRGMEEASKFLPGGGGAAGTADCRGRKKRLELDGDDEVDEGSRSRSSKQMAADGEEPEEAAAREMLDQLVLNGGDDDEPMLAAADTQELRAAMDTARATPPGRPPRGTRADHQDQPASEAEAVAVDLQSMLIRCADAVASNDRRNAADLLARIRRHSSPTGDGAQRLAHCFAEGLEVRLNGTGSLLQLHHRASSSSLTPKTAAQLRARQLFTAKCCFLPVSTFFCNRTIYNAAAGRKKLHVVLYGLDHGLQLAPLLRWLARRDGGPPAVRLTGIDAPQPGFRPARLIEDAGRRLAACARQLGVPFAFRGIAARSESVRAGDLDIDPDEVLVVSSLFHFRTLRDDDESTSTNTATATDSGGGAGAAGGTDPIGVVLGAVREMRPAVFVHAVLNASYSTAFFATRFREALYNFSALFDMLDTVLPQRRRDDDDDDGDGGGGGSGRLLIEREVLARCAVNVIACEGADRVLHPRSYKQWQARSRRAGLRQLPLDRDVVQAIRDKVRREYHGHFVVTEDHGWLLQGWKGRMIYAISTWTADDDWAGT